MSKTAKTRIVVTGAAGRMGQETVRAILKEPELELVGVVGRRGSELIGQDIGEIVGKKPINVALQDNLKDILDRTKPDVMVDFTVPGTVFMNAQIALESGARPIIGATGLSEEDLCELEKKAKFYDSAVLIAPNFAIGALLMIECSRKIARYFENVEIIEFHHEKKVDAPSGTSLKTAHALASIREFKHQELSPNSPARGELHHGIRIHSLRLPGLLAHQEVVFGSTGQTLSLRHDTLDRTAFMPGVVLAVRAIMKRRGLIYGLENLLDL